MNGLESYGYTAGSRTSRTEAVVDKHHTLAWVATGSTSRGLIPSSIVDPMRIPWHSIDSLSNAKDVINLVVPWTLASLLIFHNISGDGNLTESEFEDLYEYIDNKDRDEIE